MAATRSWHSNGQPATPAFPRPARPSAQDWPSAPSVAAPPPPAAANKQGHFECPRCGRAYKFLPSLRNHLNHECGIEPKFACPFCDYRARHKHHLTSHLKTQHRN